MAIDKNNISLWRRPDRDTVKAQELKRIEGVYLNAQKFCAQHTPQDVLDQLKDVQRHQDDMSRLAETYTSEGLFVKAYDARCQTIRINRNVFALLDPHFKQMREYAEVNEGEPCSDDSLMDLCAEQDTDQLLDAYGLMEYDIAESKALEWSRDTGVEVVHYHTQLWRASLRGVVVERWASPDGQMVTWNALIRDESGASHPPIKCDTPLVSLDDAFTWVGARI